MQGTRYNDVSNDLFKLIFQIQKKTFNHDKLTKCMPVPPSHAKVVFHLTHHGPSSVSNIGKDLAISKPNMTPIIDKLVQEGLVTRYEDPKDRRRILVDVTKKGRSLLDLRKQGFINELSAKISTLSDEDIDILSESTQNLIKIISKL